MSGALLLLVMNFIGLGLGPTYVGAASDWFATRGGLSRYARGRFTTYRQREGIFHDAAQRVLEDGRGYLWLTSHRGRC